jgi:signal transduction histidine kinase
MIETERAQSPSRLAGNRSSPDSVDFQFSESGKAPELAAFVAKDLLRIAQEALHNAVHHSSASTVRISLSCRDETVRILLEDNGCGFNLEEALARPDSFGIAGMRERARQIRATLDISPRPAGGTAVLIEYPAMEIPVVKGDS